LIILPYFENEIVPEDLKATLRKKKLLMKGGALAQIEAVSFFMAFSAIKKI
jgi:hypothetical protein